MPGFDCDGLQLEAFDLPVNLMLGVPVTVITGSPHECLHQLAAALRR
jgi:nucleoside 2-deoxyribosyltransferase